MLLGVVYSYHLTMLHSYHLNMLYSCRLTMFFAYVVYTYQGCFWLFVMRTAAAFCIQFLSAALIVCWASGLLPLKLFFS